MGLLGLGFGLSVLRKLDMVANFCCVVSRCFITIKPMRLGL